MKQKKRKTYVRFLGMIFWGVFQSALVAGRQWVAKAKTTKNCKRTKKSVIFLARPPVFLPKEALFLNGIM
jgi:hypothetical protein